MVVRRPHQNYDSLPRSRAAFVYSAGSTPSAASLSNPNTVRSYGRSSSLRDTIEEVHYSCFKAIFGTYDQESVSLNQLLQNVRPVSQMVC